MVFKGVAIVGSFINCTKLVTCFKEGVLCYTSPLGTHYRCLDHTATEREKADRFLVISNCDYCSCIFPARWACNFHFSQYLYLEGIVL